MSTFCIIQVKRCVHQTISGHLHMLCRAKSKLCHGHGQDLDPDINTAP